MKEPTERQTREKDRNSKVHNGGDERGKSHAQRACVRKGREEESAKKGLKMDSSEEETNVEGVEVGQMREPEKDKDSPRGKKVSLEKEKMKRTTRKNRGPNTKRGRERDGERRKGVGSQGELYARRERRRRSS